MPALGPLIALAAGILTAMWLTPHALWIGAICGVAAMALYFARWKRAAVMCLFLLVGIAVYVIHTPVELTLPDDGTEVRIKARVTDVRQNERSQRLILETSVDTADPSRLLVYYHSLIPLIGRGDIVEAKLALQKPDGAYRVPDEFSMAPYCTANNIVALAHCRGDAITVIGYQPDFSERIARWRSRVSDFIYYKSGLKPDAAEMLNALLTGNDDFIDPDLRSDFASAGVAHVLALSGTHLAIIIMMLGIVLLPLRIGGRRTIGTLAMLAVLWCYVAFTGWAPSVVRACLMVSIVAVGRMAGLGSNPMNSLFVAAILILVVWPKSILNAGFQLSFAAVLAILMFAARIRDAAGRNALLRVLFGWIGVCVAAVAGTVMISAWHFHEVPVMFLAANLPVGVLMPWFMGLGVVKLLLCLGNVDATWLAWCLNHIYDAMTWVATTIGRTDGASVKGIYFNGWWMLPYFAMLLLIWLALERRKIIYALTGIAVAVAAIFIAELSVRNNDVESYAISDYYATTLLLRSGSQAWLVTDSPPKHYKSLGERTAFRFNEYMSKRGIDSMQIVSELHTPDFQIDPHRWSTESVEIVLLDTDFRKDSIAVERLFTPDSGKQRILLATVGFRGDIADVARKSGASLTAMSRRLSEQRRKRLYDEVSAAGLHAVIGLEGELGR